MEEWVWAWQGKMPLCTGVTGSIRATICRTPPAHTRIGSFPGVTGAPPSPPSPLLHITSTTDTTQSETSRWSHVPHSHLRHHLKSTLKKKQNTQKKWLNVRDYSSTGQCWGSLRTSGSQIGWEPEWEPDRWFSALWDLPPPTFKVLNDVRPKVERFFCLVSLLMLGVDKECLCRRIWCESIISYAFKVLPLLASYGRKWI